MISNVLFVEHPNPLSRLTRRCRRRRRRRCLQHHHHRCRRRRLLHVVLMSGSAQFANMFTILRTEMGRLSRICLLISSVLFVDHPNPFLRFTLPSRRRRRPLCLLLMGGSVLFANMFTILMRTEMERLSRTCQMISSALSAALRNLPLSQQGQHRINRRCTQLWFGSIDVGSCSAGDCSFRWEYR